MAGIRFSGVWVQSKKVRRFRKAVWGSAILLRQRGRGAQQRDQKAVRKVGVLSSRMEH